MKLITIINAVPALRTLKDAKLTYPELLALSKIVKRVETEVAFYADEEKKLVAEYADKDDNGEPKITDGKFNISDVSKRAEFFKRKNDLNETETEDFERITLSLSATDTRLTLSELEAIESFIEVT